MPCRCEACTEANRAYKRDYARRNREAVNKRNREYYHKNKKKKKNMVAVGKQVSR